MMARPLTLPRTVTLASARGGMMPVGRLYAALGWQRQRAFAMRQRYQFPQSVNGLIDVQQAATWLVSRGVNVSFV